METRSQQLRVAIVSLGEGLSLVLRASLRHVEACEAPETTLNRFFSGADGEGLSPYARKSLVATLLRRFRRVLNGNES